MKLYRVRWRHGVWQVLSGEVAIAESEDKDQLVRVARTLAARHDGELYVCNKAGKLEVSYIYVGGTETVRLYRPPRVTARSTT